MFKMGSQPKKIKLNQPENERSGRLSELSDFSSDSDGRLFNYSGDSDVELPTPTRSPSPVAGPSG